MVRRPKFVWAQAAEIKRAEKGRAMLSPRQHSQPKLLPNTKRCIFCKCENETGVGVPQLSCFFGDF